MPTTQPSGLASSAPSPKVIVAAAAALAVLAAAVFLLNPPKLHASGSSATVVSTAKTSLGRILVNSRGHTLYLFGKDRHGKSACSGQCATFWPPLIELALLAVALGAVAVLTNIRPGRDYVSPGAAASSRQTFVLAAEAGNLAVGVGVTQAATRTRRCCAPRCSARTAPPRDSASAS